MIRSLLIDNYDSYTYNLFQLMARVYGTDPVVVANDDPRGPGLARELDCVVISPGPGHPRDRHDFGFCAEVIRNARVPLLGVCLGHQGVGMGAGAGVVSAPRARHGFVSRIRHSGDELFRGIPQDFSAVRYHSLCVCEPLPPELVPAARADDGVLMALRHRERPLWGVQFHPESILTEYGARLLWNFGEIVAARRVPRPAEPEMRRYTAHAREIPFAADSAELYSELFAGSPHTVWLDSARNGPGLARFSYLAEASPELGEVLTYRLGEKQVRVETVGGGTRVVPGSVFALLAKEIERRVINAPEFAFDFSGGFIGYFGYELKSECGASARHQSALPDAVWLFADRFAVVDHARGTLNLVALSDNSARSEAAARHWLDSAALIAGDVAGRRPGPADRSGSPDPDATRAAVEESLVRDRAQYLADIAHCREKLLEGQTYEVCVTNTVVLPRQPDPLRFYRRLRERNPAPYAAFVSAGGVRIACSSPERFLKIDRCRVVESKPIKGTLPRGADAEEDERLRRELAADPKTRAENLMIVDLLRNDLGRVCEPGSVHVPSLMQVESYATVHQLVSTVRGRLRDGVSSVECVRACFPGGSMTGAPKLRTMEIIDELETRARGPYSGTIGFLSCDGTTDLNIVIRTAVFTGEETLIGAGGAIVLDSDPAAEYEEMLLKATAVTRGLAAAGPASGRAAAQQAPGVEAGRSLADERGAGAGESRGLAGPDRVPGR
ncbi:aminodeoxychorismate synthase component I [Amycolatopsis silviterrae]|uniref:aminodeoxychorismate synthase n=1 Tax=Amycolatopsis silviterrae TaxID=1656914 RepID=A0ABW5H4R3_9PSEU